MINVRIRMVDESFIEVSNYATSVKEFYKRVLAPYGNTMTFVEILPGRIINTANIVEIREIVKDNEIEPAVIIADEPTIENDEVVRDQDVPDSIETEKPEES